MWQVSLQAHIYKRDKDPQAETPRETSRLRGAAYWPEGPGGTQTHFNTLFHFEINITNKFSVNLGNDEKFRDKV